ncbi:MAG: biotin--[acetyl-CoA-carboxylase] ligase [Vicingaceae bacterium]
MSSSDFKFQIFHISELDSTNIYALAALNAKKAREGDLIWADFQRHGKGQRGSQWTAEESKNLLFSLVVEPYMEVEKQFYLSMLVANSLAELLASLSAKEVKVKWPNDILIEGKKVAGILIENNLSGSKIRASILGVGINVNQKEFGKLSQSATSLALQNKKEYNRKSLLQAWQPIFKEHYNLLKEQKFQQIKKRYLTHLFAFKVPYRFQDKAHKFVATIVDVAEDGKLLVKKEEAILAFDLKEIKFIGRV